MKPRKAAKKLYTRIKYTWHMICRALLGQNKNKSTHLECNATSFTAIPANHTIIFASCDSKYFSKYARSFITSFSSHTQDNPIHIHICNPTETAAQHAEELAMKYKRFTWSCDKIDTSSIHKKDIGIYYYSIRFVWMHEIITSNDLPCFCLDIDAFCNKDAAPLIRTLEEYDIAFYSRFNKYGHDTKLLAGTLFVNNSNSGKEFISDIRNKISYMIEKNNLLDKLDQIVIYDCYKKTKKTNPGIRFLNLKHPNIDTKFSDDGIIWYPKGASKLDSKYIKLINS